MPDEPKPDASLESRAANAPVTVLIVDDETTVARLAGSALQSYEGPVEVLYAEDALEARGHLYEPATGKPNKNIDVVVMDESFPGGPGSGLVREMYEKRHPARVIQMSGGHLGQAQATNGLPNVVALLAKPFDIDILLQHFGYAVKNPVNYDAPVTQPLPDVPREALFD
jgi:DNA-binding NtrC family response regulator